MSTNLRFRVRGPSGGQKILDGISSSNTIKDLQLAIIKKLELVNVTAPCIQIKYVFPPPQIISNVDNYNKSLSSLKLTSGNVIISIIDPPPMPILAQKKEEKKEENVNNNNDDEDYDGTMTIKEIASDNSCLFNAVSYLCEDGNVSLNDNSKSMELREIIASIVMSDPIKYNQGLLGKSNEKYIEYIMKPNTWGGYIELAILSSYYELQINAIDIITLNTHKFGEDKNYKKCIYVIYDGIHYDSLIMKLNKNNKIRYKFNTTNDEIFAQCLSIASELNAKKKFTDVYNFSLVCGICNAKLKGQSEAQKHAESTGHTQFSQYQ